MYARQIRAWVGLPLSVALLLPGGHVQELEETVVTAQRRAEELLSVPLAVVGLDFQYRF